jgi:hypothetical protein
LVFLIKVWFLPGSVFNAEQWLEQLLAQQQNVESVNSHSNSTSSTSNQCNRLSKKDLTAVIEGSFFFQPHRHPIIDPRFPSYQVSRKKGKKNSILGKYLEGY